LSNSLNQFIVDSNSYLHPSAVSDLPYSSGIKNLYHEHHGWLVRLLRRKLGDIDNAADLAQDTFTRMLSHGESAAALREPRAYLTTIASRLTAQYFRRLELERAYLAALATQPETTIPSPETRLLVVEALTAVSLILDALPVRTREIFLMSQLDGLTYPEIAQRMTVSVNVVQKAMCKAYAHCYAVVYS
jgi:RNA polymerase sigma factor (sigma-70 family)